MEQGTNAKILKRFSPKKWRKIGILTEDTASLCLKIRINNIGIYF
jgi:hypothetical protein